MKSNQNLKDKSNIALKKDLKDIYRNYPMIILLRHAERFEISKGRSGSNIQLTDNGRKASELLGKNLFYQNIGHIYSSPINRCLDTGRNILIGAEQKTLPIIQDVVLGNPGCFVSDSKICGEYFATHGTIETVLEYLRKQNLPGFRNLEEGANILKNYLIKNISVNKNKINLAISHDAIIMAFIAHFLQWEFSEDNWHNYCEGIILFKKNNHFFLRYKEITKKLDM